MAAPLARRVHVTSLFVTHDQEEALEVADPIVVMNDGRIEQKARPTRSSSIRPMQFVMIFSATSICSTAASRKAVFGSLVLDHAEGSTSNGKRARLFVRPHLLEIAHHRNGGDNFHAKVTHINAAGPLVKVELVTDWGGARPCRDLPRAIFYAWLEAGR